MLTSKNSKLVSGRKVQLSWTDGPTKGTAQEHHFYPDGTVEWHSVDAGKADRDKKSVSGSDGEKAKPERPPYAAIDIGNDVCLVSYLSKSGYTLTVALNFANQSTAGFASNDKTWIPVRGTLTVVD